MSNQTKFHTLLCLENITTSDQSPPPIASNTPSQPTLETIESVPTSPQVCKDSTSSVSTPITIENQEECSEQPSVVEVPDIQREETLSCVSPTEKNAAFLPKPSSNPSTANHTNKRPRPLSKSNKKDKKKSSSRQPPIKKQKPNSTRPRPVAKNVLKNLKVGTVGEMKTESQGNDKVLSLLNSLTPSCYKILFTTILL